MVGDIGEAVAAELFGLTLKPGGHMGIDGYAPDGRSVQIKATGTGRGAIFRHVDTRAQHLILLGLKFETLSGEVVFNGPEHIALTQMPDVWIGQRPVSKTMIRSPDALGADADRLPRVDWKQTDQLPPIEAIVST